VLIVPPLTGVTCCWAEKHPAGEEIGIPPPPAAGAGANAGVSPAEDLATNADPSPADPYAGGAAAPHPETSTPEAGEQRGGVVGGGERAVGGIEGGRGGEEGGTLALPIFPLEQPTANGMSKELQQSLWRRTYDFSAANR
jgi:hypothetical protein